MIFARVNCHICTVVPAKCDTESDAEAGPDNDLLMTMIVSAPSERRTAANDESVSGFGVASDTLMEPNAPPWPL